MQNIQKVKIKQHIIDGDIIICKNPLRIGIKKYGIKSTFMYEYSSLVSTLNHHKLVDFLLIMVYMKKNKKFKKGDVCVFVYPFGKDMFDSILDDNMIIANDDVTWLNNDWWYNIVGKANRTEQKYLRKK